MPRLFVLDRKWMMGTDLAYTRPRCCVFFSLFCAFFFSCLFPSRLQVHAKESMLTILAVCMIGTNAILEGMDSTISAQVWNRSCILHK